MRQTNYPLLNHSLSLILLIGNNIWKKDVPNITGVKIFLIRIKVVVRQIPELHIFTSDNL